MYLSEIIIQLFKFTATTVHEEITTEYGEPAFFATLSPNFTLKGIDDVIMFDRVKLNRGGAYNSSTGVFTATKPGIFHFSCTIVAEHGNMVTW